MADDCWVKIYKDDNFEGDSLILSGPVEYPNLKDLPGSHGDDWGDSIGSIQVGPKAWIKVFNDENYHDDNYTFGPNSEVRRLHNDDDIDSLIVSSQPL